LFLGIDIGGTSVRVTAFANLEQHTRVGSDDFRVSGGYDQDFRQLVDTCQLMYGSYCEEFGGVEGIGIAIAGVLNKERTKLARAGNTRQWVDQPFVGVLAEVFSCQVALGNDAEAAAMAEAVYGNPEGGDFWFVIWGTGVGGTLVRQVDGRPVAFAGEVGHQTVRHPRGNQCACGQMDCLEVYCGGAGIQKYRGVLSASELSERDWAQVLDCMADGLHNIIAIQPVPKIYFGGGIAAKQSHRIPVLETSLQEELAILPAPRMELSRFGESAGTVGALALLKSVLV
jgi:glucokinase